jgi:anthranilate synthase component 1
VLKVLKAKGRNAYILESVENGENWGRYTFLGCNPSLTLVGGNGGVTVKTPSGETARRGDPHSLLKEIVHACKSPRVAYLPTFTGGFVGYFDYAYTRNGAFCLMQYRQVIAFDHLKQKIFLITNIETENLEENYIAGVAALKDMEALVTAEGRCETPGGRVTSAFSQNLSKPEFLRAVETCQRYIAQGEVSQVVPSVRFSAAYEGDLLPVYRALRTINPSSYMFYIQVDGMQLAAASPETLVSLKNGVVSTYPLAGTCKRTGDEDENRRRLQKLLSDPKELAEHEMLVELGREDLGKVCQPGSVGVEDYRGIKTCSHVYHIESKVRGQIRPDRDAFDAMAASLPAGTLSGAPRDRAMEIIAEVEGEPRGAYGGAVGYIDFAGEMDLCIGIRMAVLKDGRVSVQAGAGVVAESVPENEYEECQNKAKAMRLAIEEATK